MSCILKNKVEVKNLDLIKRKITEHRVYTCSKRVIVHDDNKHWSCTA